MKMKITTIQIFDYVTFEQINDEGDFKKEHSFSANIALNDNVMFQVGTDKKINIPCSDEAYWNSKEKQNDFFEKFSNDIDIIAKKLGVKADRDHLIENFGVDIMYPENAPD